jgi:hypothetical protein
MDWMSQEGFSKIASVAKLALARLESPEGHKDIDDIANALGLIWSTAESAQNTINIEAENVGCNYKDEAQGRRWNAASQAWLAAKEVQHG